MKTKPNGTPLGYVKSSLLLTMKIFIFFFSVLAFGFTAEKGFSQNKKITFTEDAQLSIEEVLEVVKKQTDYNFIYRSDLFVGSPLVEVKKGTVKVGKLLNRCATLTDLEFRFDDSGSIFLQKSPKTVLNKIVQQSVTGSVTDSGGLPLPGANIVEKGTTNGVTADFDGNFSMEVSNDDAILVVSYIGFATNEVPINGQTNLVITLTESAASLDEVVLIGYGTQRSKDLTGAISTIDQKKIQDLPVSSVDQQLVGQLPGVQIQQVSGAPGGGTSVKIRGSGSLGAGNEPLYVVDGMPYSSGLNQNLNPLVFINPNNIESITILKDASSTAIYGSRGANGVIMITTKKGKAGLTQINFTSSYGIQQVPSQGRPDLMNQRQFAEFQRDRIDIEVRQRENREPVNADYPEEYRDLNALVGKGTDWYDLILQAAPTQDYNFNLLKGTENSRMDFNLGYFKQDGVLRHTGVERISSKIGVELDLGEQFKIGASLQPTFINQDRANTNQNRSDVIGVSLWANPISKSHDENGNLIPYITTPQSPYHSTWSFANPLFELQESTRNSKTFQNLGIAYVEWDITPSLSVRSSFNTIFSASKFYAYIPSTVGGANRPPIEGTGSSANTRSDSFNWLTENTMKYENVFGKHRINGLLGYTAQQSKANSISINAGPFSNDLIRTINAAQAIGSWGESVNEWSMISYLGRVNYGFDDRYLLTATFRSDGSSRFGSENRFAFFPSIAGAWRVSEEEFFTINNFVNSMKLRVSYGKSGNNNIGNYSHLASVNAGAYIFGNNQVTASYLGISNPFLTWEESGQFDVGLDLELFNNRISLTLDYYNRKSNDMLLNDVIPTTSGFGTQTINQGSVSNKGFEIALGASIIQGDFNWDLNANMSINRNKILSLNDNTERILAGSNDGNPTHVSVVGKPIGQFYGFELEGVYTSEDLQDPSVINSPQVYVGNVKYKDVDGDGIVNDVLDYTIIGNPHPDFIFGFTNNFSYKNIDLGIIVNGQYGGQVMNGLRQTIDNLQGFFNVSEEWVDRYRSEEQPGDGIHSGIPTARPSWGHRVSSLWVEDASYLRIANLTLGYTLPTEIVEKSGFVKGLRLYGSVQNLAMFTKYSGGNPEGQAINQNNTLAPGFDMSSYPLPRTISIGTNITF
ncbi:TonB-dependent receptor [uncultured Zobellia sp.]|uniref:SusC/RagA family TonB-linked outer membrane protein n=1 Tax=uncultured Zobellia sp. TaxID=255433 RepID=UPI002597ECF8|nr:TonB-dependent receptor [uncultured Zobellia sp.]